MALVVFRKCRRVTDLCLFPPYPIAQLLFAMVTMMLLMLTPCLRSTTGSAARHRPDGPDSSRSHRPSRSTGPSALRRKCATQRECRGSVRRTRQSGPTPGPPPLALSRTLAAPSERTAIRGVAHTVSAIWPCAIGMASGFMPTWSRAAPERTWATLALATRYGAIPGLSEFVGDPPRDRALGR